MRNYKSLLWIMIACASIFSFQSCDSVENDNILGDIVNPADKNDGSLEKPYSVSELITFNPTSTSVPVATDKWVTGYIVGYRHSENTEDGSYIAADYFGVQESYLSEVNFYISETATETDYKKCVSIQLPIAYRTILGLKSNPDNMGKEVMIKGDILKYNNVPGIKNMTNYRLDGQGPEEKPQEDYEFEGTGELDKPFTVTDVISLNPTSTSEALKSGVWAKGYVVGYRHSENSSYTDYLGPQESYLSDYNIYLAADATETSTANCINIQVTTDYRSVLGLMSKPENMGKEVMVKGDIMKYNGVPGVKNMSNYRVDGQGPEDNNDEGEEEQPSDIEVSGDLATAVTSLSYSFDDVTNNVDFIKEGWQNLFTQGSRKWQGKYYSKDGNYYLGATAYGAENGKTQESWVITPGINLDLSEAKILSFRSAVAYWNETSEFEIYVLQNLEGKTVKTKLEGMTLPTSSAVNYVFVESGEIDLSNYSGVVYIGFMYRGIGGGSGTSATWCIDDIVVGKSAAAPETTLSLYYGNSSVYYGEELNCEITTTVANGEGTTIITAEGLPSWATLVGGENGTATITGTAPTTPSTTSVTVTAVNNGKEATKTFDIVVKEKVVVNPGDALVANGNFENGTEGWSFIYDKYEGIDDLYVITTKDGLNIDQTAAANCNMFFNQEIVVEEGAEYKLTFKYKATHKKLRIWSRGLSQSGAPVYFTSSNATDAFRSFNDYFPISTDWTTWTKAEEEVELKFTATFPNFLLEFRTYKQEKCSLAIKDIVLEKL